MNFKRITESPVAKKLDEHKPEIFIGATIGLAALSVYTAVKATPKALSLISDAEQIKGGKLTVKETVKVAWKPYVATAAAFASMCASVLYASRTYNIRIANSQLTTTLISQAYMAYKDEARKALGEEKEKEVQVNASKASKPVTQPETEAVFGGGKYKCKDAFSGRYFYSDRDTLTRIINKLNYRMMSEMSITLNEYYYEIGLESIPNGEDLGWHIDRGLIEPLFTADLDSDGHPCLCVSLPIHEDYMFLNRAYNDSVMNVYK